MGRGGLQKGRGGGQGKFYPYEKGRRKKSEGGAQKVLGLFFMRYLEVLAN